MANLTQSEADRLFENIGGAFGGLKRYEESAELIGSTSYFLFTKRDEFDMFPDPAIQFRQMANLLRDIGYDGADDILRIEVTEVTPGATFSLKIVESFGGTVLATASGSFGTFEDLTATVNRGPVGKIRVDAPSSALPGADQPVFFRVVASAPRLSMDVPGETEKESLLEAAAIESHQVTASNLRGTLLNAARNRVVVDRLFRKLVGGVIGSSTQQVAGETQSAETSGAVASVTSGLLTELDIQLQVNTPVQTVRQFDVTFGTTVFGTQVGTEEGVLTTTERQPVGGTLQLKCTRGFTAEVDDPELFEVRYLEDEFSRTILSTFQVRPFRDFVWNDAGFVLNLTRKTVNDDPFGRMTATVLKNATPSRIRLRKYKITVGPFAVSGPTFTITDLADGSTVFSEFAFPDGAKDLSLFNGVNLTFTWANNPSAVATSEFEITIHPYRVGDVFTVPVTSLNGRLQKEIRRHFNFAFTQASATPTIPDTVVPPDLPFVRPLLGA